MALGHFSIASSFAKININPVYRNLCVVNFEDEYMKECCYSIQKNTMRFNVKIIQNNEITPLFEIQKMIKNKTKINLDIEHTDTSNAIIYHVLLEDFYFVKFKDLLDFDWNFPGVQSISVKFKYKNMTYLNAIQYKSYIRKLKLQKLS